MGQVINLWASQETDVVKTLQKLLELAMAGRINGLIYVVDRADRHKAGMSGTYRERPSMALNIASKSMTKLYTYEAHKRIDPLTASNYVN